MSELSKNNPYLFRTRTVISFDKRRESLTNGPISKKSHSLTGAHDFSIAEPSIGG